MFSNAITRKRLTRQTYAAKEAGLLRKNLEDLRRQCSEINPDPELKDLLSEIEYQITETETRFPIGRSELRAFLDQIPDQTLVDAAWMHFWSGLSYREIGERNGCNAAALKERCQVAIRKIIEPETVRPMSAFADYIKNKNNQGGKFDEGN